MQPTTNPLIIQSNRTLLLEVDNPLFEECRKAISKFAELDKSPEYLHTYKISTLSLWNAASSNLSAEKIIDVLYKYSKYPVPQVILAEIHTQISRYGKLCLERDEQGNLILTSEDAVYLREIQRTSKVSKYIEGVKNANSLYISAMYRGHIKQALIRIGFPVCDIAGYDKGNEYSFSLSEKLDLRNYQSESADIFYADGSVQGGSGVIVLPCGAGKTIVGIAAMYKVQVQTLILVTNTLSIRQWKNEIMNNTTIPEEDIGEYSGQRKEIRPITIATYNIITYKNKKNNEFSHFHLVSSSSWGFIIYDEVHLLPAPVFRMTSELQAKRRLGLTATLIREDGLEEDVFSLIGPKKFELPWKELEKQNWIAQARCMEIRVPMRSLTYSIYAEASERVKFRLSAENPEKRRIIAVLLKKHHNDRILVIGQYLEQLHKVAKKFNLPLISGSTPISEREKLYDAFRKGNVPTLVVSKVANFSIDLPNANVAIQISGTFGSRQEEAQRLGRILRPKIEKHQENKSIFYSIVTQDSHEERFAQNRQLFLTEQGYEYKIYTYEHFKKEFGSIFLNPHPQEQKN